MKDQSELVATAPCNRTQLVAVGSVAVHPKSKISATGRGPVASQKGQKTGPDWTLKHYVHTLLRDPEELHIAVFVLDNDYCVVLVLNVSNKVRWIEKL